MRFLATIAVAIIATSATAQVAVPNVRLTLDTPIETIVADPAGKAVLQADFPEMLAHPSYPDFKSNSLNQVQPMAQGAITDEMMAKAKADLAGIK